MKKQKHCRAKHSVKADWKPRSGEEEISKISPKERRYFGKLKPLTWGYASSGIGYIIGDTALVRFRAAMNRIASPLELSEGQRDVAQEIYLKNRAVLKHHNLDIQAKACLIAAGRELKLSQPLSIFLVPKTKDEGGRGRGLIETKKSLLKVLRDLDIMPAGKPTKTALMARK